MRELGTTTLQVLLVLGTGMIALTLLGMLGYGG
jgi:hypothetical protein